MAVEIAPHFVVNHFTLANVYVAMVSVLSPSYVWFWYGIYMYIKILFSQIILKEQHSRSWGSINKERVLAFKKYSIIHFTLITYLLLEDQHFYKLASECCLQSFVKTVANNW